MRFRPHNERGMMMIAMLILILLGFIIGLAKIYLTRTSVRLSADFRGKTSLYYKAEEGINKSLAKFINNENHGKQRTEGDILNRDSDGFNTFKGPITCDTAGDAFAPDGSGDSDSIHCDFLIGDVTSPDSKGFTLQVMISRRPDHCKNGSALDGTNRTCESLASPDVTDGQVYLVNSVAMDKSGRQEVAQGVFIIPMLRTLEVSGGNLMPITKRHPYLSPYLAALTRGNAHKAPSSAP